MTDEESSLDAYKAIIDELVTETRCGGSSTHVSESGLFSNAPAQDRYNEFIATLSAGQRKLLSEMLQEERDGAIHDLLAALTWWIDCQEVRLTHRGKPMSIDLSGMGMHGDFIGRRDGWQWPSNES